jgi:ribonuclease P protein component
MPNAPALIPLKKRSEFLAVAASGKKWITPGLIMQIKKHETVSSKAMAERRFGLTATKRMGNAVKRNRARRRLRALAHEIIAINGAPLTDYVLIARPATVTRPFADLRQDMILALKRLKAWQETI